MTTPHFVYPFIHLLMEFELFARFGYYEECVTSLLRLLFNAYLGTDTGLHLESTIFHAFDEFCL